VNKLFDHTKEAPMKRTILAVLMAVMVATPCFAQEVEDDGSVWSRTTIFAYPPETSSCTMPRLMGFYNGRVYKGHGETWMEVTNKDYASIYFVNIMGTMMFYWPEFYLSPIFPGMHKVGMLNIMSGSGIVFEWGIFLYAEGDDYPYKTIVRIGMHIHSLSKEEDGWVPPEDLTD